MLKRLRRSCQAGSSSPAALLAVAVALATACANRTPPPPASTAEAAAPVAVHASAAPVAAASIAPATSASVVPVKPASQAADALAAGERLGTMRQVGSFGFAIVPDDDPGTRYAPDRLAKEFEVEGMRVVFKGVEAPSPEGVRQWGTPMRLATIRPAQP